ncbi:hypothetical protein [Cognatilysobacter terrigena]|uniref:hypothetical protein n=1 Tax=Cognatilysobacter terrigena TaxID=2488749 RepID=UPI00105D5074|nr:hypothetical protein [Lysobacter terrigena]
MSEAIRFLETLACDPRADARDFEALRTLPAEMRRAVLRRDASGLAGLLGGRTTMACAIMLPDNEEPADAPYEPEDVPEEPGRPSEGVSMAA